MSQGVSILSGELAEAGHEVQIAHYHERLPGPQTEGEFARSIAAREPDVVLYSFGTNQAAIAHRVADQVRALMPKVPMMSGGVHSTLTPEEPLSWGSLDYAYVGEADGRMDELVTRMGRGEDLASLPNIACMRDGKMKRNPVGPLPDITKQHEPYWEGLDYRDLAMRTRGVIDVVAGRGCPYRCKYCHNAGLIDLYRNDLKASVAQIGFLRTRDPHALLAECVKYRELCGEHLKTFAWGDDQAVMSKPFMRTWAEIYPRALPDVPFAINATLNYVDDEVAELLGRAGCNLVKFGLESGSPRIRKFLGRPDHKEEVLLGALERLRRHDINTRAYVIVGTPTETREELLQTFRFAAKLGLDTVRPSILFPYPGTPLYDYCVENDLIDHELLADVRNYYERSVLRGFEPDMAVLLARIMDSYPILMNAELGGEVGEAFAPLARVVLDASEEEWLGGARQRVLGEQTALNQVLHERKLVFYAVPFQDRPDASFLQRPRRRPLVNIDDTPNLTIEAAL